MDKKWQDLFYINPNPQNKPVSFNVFTDYFEEVVFGVRQVHILTIVFGTSDIKIDYKDIKSNYHSVTLKKLPNHYLRIE